MCRGATVRTDRPRVRHDHGRGEQQSDRVEAVRLRVKPSGELLRELPMSRTGGGEVWFSIRSDTSNLIYLHMKTGAFSLEAFAQAGLTAKEQAWLFFAFLIAFAIKVPMWPVHTWLPTRIPKRRPPDPLSWQA